MIDITLADWELEWAAHVGTKRMLLRKDSQPAKHYADRARLQPEIIATIATCCCEIAVARAYNLYWGGHFWRADEHSEYKNLADVGNNTEVRRVRSKETKKFAVRWSDVSLDRRMAAAYVDIDDMSKVTVYGHTTAALAWESGEPSDFDPDKTRYCPISILS